MNIKQVSIIAILLLISITAIEVVHVGFPEYKGPIQGPFLVLMFCAGYKIAKDNTRKTVCSVPE
jgi:hypothetical protein